jgi:hypothetical protein
MFRVNFSDPVKRNVILYGTVALSKWKYQDHKCLDSLAALSNIMTCYDSYRIYNKFSSNKEIKDTKLIILLDEMTAPLKVFFSIDIVNLIINYNKINKEFILHHILTMLWLRYMNKNIQNTKFHAYVLFMAELAPIFYNIFNLTSHKTPKKILGITYVILFILTRFWFIPKYVYNNPNIVKEYSREGKIISCSLYGLSIYWLIKILIVLIKKNYV